MMNATVSQYHSKLVYQFMIQILLQCVNAYL